MSKRKKDRCVIIDGVRVHVGPDYEPGRDDEYLRKIFDAARAYFREHRDPEVRDTSQMGNRADAIDPEDLGTPIPGTTGIARVKGVIIDGTFVPNQETL